jgi:hypothetical protein
MMPPAKH